MTLYLLLIASANLAIGYALGVHFGQMPWTSRAAEAEEPPKAERRQSQPTTAAKPPAAAPKVESEAPAPQPPVGESSAGNPQDDLPGDPAEVGTSLGEFRSALDGYRQQLVNLTGKVNNSSASPTTGQIQSCLAELRVANDQYVLEQATAVERLKSAATTEAAELNARVGEAVEMQLEQVKDSSSRLEDIAQESNLLASCQRLLDETSKLARTSGELDQSLADATLELADRGQPDGRHKSRLSNLLENLPDRNQLKETITQVWERDCERRNSLMLAFLSLDGVKALAELGPQLHDRVLEAIAQTVVGAVRPEDVVARPGETQLAVLFHSTTARTSTSIIERIRQTIAATTFRHGESRLEVTVSCGVAEALDNDSVDALLERVDLALEQAQRYGHNRTFLHEGKFPAPVVPPQLAVDKRVLEV